MLGGGLEGKVTLFGRIITPWAREYRNNLVLRYVKGRNRLLDIGYGGGFLLLNSPCRENIGVDELNVLRIVNREDGGKKIVERTDIKVVDKFDFPDCYFDYVTLVATIEHLDYPDKIIAECARVLNNDGLLILTTNKWFMDLFFKLFINNGVSQIHKGYFDLKRLNRLCRPWFDLVLYKTFQLGTNQLFVYRKARSAERAVIV